MNVFMYFLNLIILLPNRTAYIHKKNLQNYAKFKVTQKLLKYWMPFLVIIIS